MKTLVAFFSASGITKEVAQTIANVANAELYEPEAFPSDQSFFRLFKEKK